MLAQPAVADFMQAMGAAGAGGDEGRRAPPARAALLVQRRIRVGTGRRREAHLRRRLLSSFGESRFALDDPKPRRSPFDLKQVLRTRYRSDAFQEAYFVIPSFAALLRLLEEADLGALYPELETLPDLDP